MQIQETYEIVPGRVDGWFRVVNNQTGEESALYSKEQCQSIIEMARSGALCGSFDITPSVAYSMVKNIEFLGDFVDEFMQEHPDVDVHVSDLYYGEAYLLGTDKNTKLCYFAHTLGDSAVACWHNYNEIGAPYQPWFSNALVSLGSVSPVWDVSLSGQVMRGM